MSGDPKSLSLIPAQRREIVTPEIVDDILLEIDPGNPFAPPEVEVLSKGESTYQKEKGFVPPVPAHPLDRPLVERPSLTPVAEADSAALLSALSVLDIVAASDELAVKITYHGGPPSTLFLETVTPLAWVAVSVPASSKGDSEFSVVTSLRRTINTVRSIDYKVVQIGIDPKGVLFGNLRIPFDRPVKEFPRHMPLLTAEVRMALPRGIAEEMVRLFQGDVVLDPVHKKAWSSNGKTVLVLDLHGTVFEMKNHTVPAPVVRVPRSLLVFLLAVATGDFLALEINDLQIIAGGEGFSVMYRAALDEAAPIPVYAGYWSAGRKTFEAALRSLNGTAGCHLEFNGKKEAGILRFLMSKQERRGHFSAQRVGGPAFVDFVLDVHEALRVVTSLKSEVLQFWFDDERGQRSRSPMVIKGAEDSLVARLSPRKDL